MLSGHGWSWQSSPTRVHLFHVGPDSEGQLRTWIQEGRYITLCGTGPLADTRICAGHCLCFGTLRPLCKVCWRLWEKVLAESSTLERGMT